MKFKFLGIVWNILPLLQLLWIFYLGCIIGGSLFLDKMSGPVMIIYGILAILTVMGVESINKKLDSLREKIGE